MDKIGRFRIICRLLQVCFLKVRLTAVPNGLYLALDCSLSRGLEVQILIEALQLLTLQFYGCRIPEIFPSVL